MGLSELKLGGEVLSRGALKIAFLHHEYHGTTRSSEFFLSLLGRQSEVSLFSLAPDISIPREMLSELLSFDLICVWQMENAAKAVADSAPDKLIFVPMYDSCWQLPDSWWGAFKLSRIISFSWTLHSRIRHLGLDSYQTQYFPNPQNYSLAIHDGKLRGFAWQRRQDFGLDKIEILTHDVKWDSFQLHLGLDPGFGKLKVPSPRQTSIMNLTISHFDQSTNQNIENNANVYFAPRRLEGIGMSFLEAMARGQCVVASNAPTMSEYIESGVNGMLYAPDIIRPIDLSSNLVRELGMAARRRVENGFRDWQKDALERLPEIIFSKKSPGLVYTRAQSEFSTPSPGANAKIDPSISGPPLVTIAIVVRNAVKGIEKTVRSAISQSFERKEIIVVDGASDDGTLQILEKYKFQFDRFLSEPDGGVYSAMNKAVDLARGTYVIFMNAGDVFTSPAAIERAINFAPTTADFIIGDHIYYVPGKSEEYHGARDFEHTWNTLQSGRISHQWQSGIPCHQSTFTRRSLLQKHRYSSEFKIAADHEFMFRMRKIGASFFHCGECISVYEAGGMSAQNLDLCVEEWWRIARKFGDREAVDHFFQSNYTSLEIGGWLTKTRLNRIRLFISKHLRYLNARIGSCF